MSKLDLVILTEDDIPEPETGTRLTTEEHGLEDQLDKLARAWPVLMERLKGVIDSNDTDVKTENGFGLESIQFQIGIEAGFTFGFTGTGNAAITVTFARPKAGV